MARDISQSVMQSAIISQAIEKWGFMPGRKRIRNIEERLHRLGEKGGKARRSDGETLLEGAVREEGTGFAFPDVS